MDTELEQKIQSLIKDLNREISGNDELANITFGRFNTNNDKVELEYFNNGIRHVVKINEINIEDNSRTEAEKQSFLTEIIENGIKPQLRKIYKLTPRKSEINNPDWSLSTTKEELLIRAASKERARRLACIATSVAVERSGSSLNGSPWGNEALSDCLPSIEKSYPNEGKEQILKPEHLDRELHRDE